MNALLSLSVLLCTHFIAQSLASPAVVPTLGKKNLDGIFVSERIQEQVRSQNNNGGIHVTQSSAQTLSKAVGGEFSNLTEDVSGTAQIFMDSGVITNISDVNIYRTGNATSEVLFGGVGWSYVVFFYYVPVGSELSFTTYIYTDENSTQGESMPQFSDVSKFSGRQKVNAASEELAFLSVLDSFLPSNKSRTVINALTFNKEMLDCEGFGFWLNGNSTRNITGGIGDNVLNVVTSVPAGITGFNVHACYHARKQFLPQSAKKDLGLKLAPGAEETVAQIQNYQTIRVDTKSLEFDLGSGSILDVEYEAQWKSGTGSVSIIKDGVGYDDVVIGVNKTESAYGSLQSNLHYSIA